jgi:Na+-transporting methylmalonyl-CoA/oxaloacetate decarboxylase gamma subunit
LMGANYIGFTGLASTSEFHRRSAPRAPLGVVAYEHTDEEEEAAATREDAGHISAILAAIVHEHPGGEPRSTQNTGNHRNGKQSIMF